MKKISILLASLVSFYLPAAELTPAKGVSILYINGQEAESKMGANSITEGYNQIVIRMDKEVGRGSGGNVFTSNPYVLDFETSGEKIRVDHPVARSKKEAEMAFSDGQPQWDIRQDGKPLQYKQEELQGKSGLFPYAGMAALLEKHNSQRGVYFNNGQLIDKPVEAKMISGTVVDPAVDTTQAISPTKALQSSNTEQLKAWYLKSSVEERKEFRRWMIDQE